MRTEQFDMNGHIQHLIGLGVSHAPYRSAYRREIGTDAAQPCELGRLIDDGRHVFVALPDTELGEFQHVFAALILDETLATVLRRKPDDPANQETELVADEFPVYASKQLCTVLARSRAFALTGHLFCQGLHQVPQGIRDEIKTNTALKFIGPTDHTGEARDAGELLFVYDDEDQAPTEQEWRSLVRNLKPRHFVVKGRARPATPIITPDYREPYSLQDALALATRRAVAPLVSPAEADRELAWRRTWITRIGAEHAPAEPPPAPRSRTKKGTESPPVREDPVVVVDAPLPVDRFLDNVAGETYGPFGGE
jgi:hypothetical protein